MTLATILPSSFHRSTGPFCEMVFSRLPWVNGVVRTAWQGDAATAHLSFARLS